MEYATNWREAHHWIIWLLPAADFGVGLVYYYVGHRVDAGNNLFTDEIHDLKKVVPRHMLLPSKA